MCVCVCERERERESVRVCVCVGGWVGVAHTNEQGVDDADDDDIDC